MFGTHTHGGFHDAEVAIFLGKNPWHSHGFDEARRVLKEISNDETRSLIVIDPRRTETADLADYWLQVRPGTDAFLLAAIGAVIVNEGLTDDRWLSENTVGAEPTKSVFAKRTNRGLFRSLWNPRKSNQGRRQTYRHSRKCFNI